MPAGKTFAKTAKSAYMYAESIYFALHPKQDVMAEATAIESRILHGSAH